MVTQNIKIIMDDSKLPDIRMVSGDVGRDIFPAVYASEDSEEALDLTVYQLRVIFIKPDNTFVIEDYLDGMIEIPEQAGAITGRGFYQIRLSKDGEEIYSGQGDFYVDDQVLNDSMVESVAEVNGLQFPDDFLTSDDLSDYVKQEQLEDYATKQYVDDAIAGIDPLDNYSTNEQIVGTWIDGTTPVYEKTYYFASLSRPSDWTPFDSSTSISTLLYSDVVMSLQNGQQGGVIVRVAYNTPHYNNSLCYYYDGHSQDIYNVYITVRYTKPII